MFSNLPPYFVQPIKASHKNAFYPPKDRFCSAGIFILRASLKNRKFSNNLEVLNYYTGSRTTRFLS